MSTHFYQRCYTLLEQIPKGKVTTYAEIAKALDSKAYQAVGSAMAKNKLLIIRPCHRVICSDGYIGEYALGTDKKIELLLQEGIEIVDGRVYDLNKFIYTFKQQSNNTL